MRWTIQGQQAVLITQPICRQRLSEKYSWAYRCRLVGDVAGKPLRETICARLLALEGGRPPSRVSFTFSTSIGKTNSEVTSHTGLTDKSVPMDMSEAGDQ